MTSLETWKTRNRQFHFLGKILIFDDRLFIHNLRVSEDFVVRIGCLLLNKSNIWLVGMVHVLIVAFDSFRVDSTQLILSVNNLFRLLSLIRFWNLLIYKIPWYLAVLILNIIFTFCIEHWWICLDLGFIFIFGHKHTLLLITLIFVSFFHLKLLILFLLILCDSILISIFINRSHLTLKIRMWHWWFCFFRIIIFKFKSGFFLNVGRIFGLILGLMIVILTDFLPDMVAVSLMLGTCNLGLAGLRWRLTLLLLGSLKTSEIV